MSTDFLRYGALLGLALGLAGCNPIRGELDVSQSMTLIVNQSGAVDFPCPDTDRPQDCEPAVTQEAAEIRPGRYATDLTFVSDRQVELKLVEPGYPTREIEFELPPSVRLPEYNGHFAVTAAELRQSIGLSGDVETTVSESEYQHGYEACYYTIERWGCDHYYHHRVKHRHKHHKRHHKKHRKRHHHGRCGIRRYRVEGTREVGFRNIFTTRAVELELVAPESGDVVARFDGKQTNSDRRYEHIGQCY